MTLRFLGTTSDGGDCPTLYAIEGTDEILVQGERETDPQHLVQLRDVKPSETFVRVPRELLTRFAPRHEPSDLIPFAEMANVFTTFKHTAWRLETRRGYATDRHSEAWARWQAGEDVAHDEPDAWRHNAAEQTAQGKTFGRVRIADEPLTEGQRFLLTRAPSNVAAGDEVRYLWRTDAVRLGLPDFDFWLIDSRSVLRFVFDEQDTTLGVIVNEDPAEVLAACQARDAAWHYAVPAAEFAAQVPSIV
ncbi:DUF6879 family protein [Streptomyces olivochromogenes]|uniref:DUF6879 family protein n=1 Tax=Streptomyces olivochromogenes TaxID=1963 RepID=UPI001F20D80B|nr:DUF6879 family protein [Streptomyces olivochromogenes]MCF3132481.1 hypothetical protein [Streptomyces olivochromogenes]